MVSIGFCRISPEHTVGNRIPIEKARGAIKKIPSIEGQELLSVDMDESQSNQFFPPPMKINQSLEESLYAKKNPTIGNVDDFFGAKFI